MRGTSPYGIGTITAIHKNCTRKSQSMAHQQKYQVHSTRN